MLGGYLFCFLLINIFSPMLTFKVQFRARLCAFIWGNVTMTGDEMISLRRRFPSSVYELQDQSEDGVDAWLTHACARLLHFVIEVELSGQADLNMILESAELEGIWKTLLTISWRRVVMDSHWPIFALLERLAIQLPSAAKCETLLGPGVGWVAYSSNMSSQVFEDAELLTTLRQADVKLILNGGGRFLPEGPFANGRLLATKYACATACATSIVARAISHGIKPWRPLPKHVLPSRIETVRIQLERTWGVSSANFVMNYERSLHLGLEYLLHRAQSSLSRVHIAEVLSTPWPLLRYLGDFGGYFIMPHPGRVDFLKRILPKNSGLLEAGAHDGMETVMTAASFPHALLIAVEPHPHVFKKLESRIDACKHCGKRVTTVNAALSEMDSTSLFYVTHNGTDSLDPASPGWGTDAQSSLFSPKNHNATSFNNFTKPIPMQVRSLSSLMKELHIRVNYLEFDMQGAEMMALRGAGKVLDDVIAIKTECIPNGLNYEGSVATFEQQHEFLASVGFDLIVYENQIWKDHKTVHNAFYMRRTAMDIRQK